MLLLDIQNKISPTPGLPRKELITRCYAAEILETLMESKNLIIFDEVEKLGTVTENHLLLGFWDWEMYSSTGNSLIWTDDITMRLFGKRGLAPEELEQLTGGKDLVLLQAEALKEAARYVLDILREAKEEPATAIA